MYSANNANQHVSMAKKPAKPTGPVANMPASTPPHEGWEGLVTMYNRDSWPAVYRNGTYIRLPETDPPTILNPATWQRYL